MPGFQSTQLATEGALEPFFFLYTDDSIQGNPETCKQSSIMLNYEVKNNMFLKMPFYRDDLCYTGFILNNNIFWQVSIEIRPLINDFLRKMAKFRYQ